MAMTEDGKGLVQKVLTEVWDKGHYDAVDEYFADDFVDHTPGLSGEDREGQKHAAEIMRKAFPDLKTSPADILVEGDRVVLHYHAVGTHEGELMGVSPTHKKVCMGGMSIYRVENGKLKEHWGYFDTANLLQQLGMQIPFEGGGSSQGFSQSGGQRDFAQAEQRAGSHYETTVRAGQTDLHAGMPKGKSSS
jgi:steroid delta-isomerase-like uncharacterized protein